VNGSLVVSGCLNWSHSATAPVTTPSGFTDQSDQFWTDWDSRSKVAYRNSGTQTDTHTWTTGGYGAIAVAIEVPAASGGGPSAQTRGAQIASFALSGIAGTRTLGAGPAQSKTAQISSLTLTTLTGTITAGAASLTAQVATLMLTGVAGVNAGGPTTRPAQIAELYFTGIPGSGTIVGGGGEPILLTVGLVTGATAALTWTAPPSGGLIDIYTVEMSLDNSVWTFNTTSAGAATSALAMNLTPFTTYYFRVQAYFSASGPGPWSAAVTATTTDYVLPGSPLSLTVGTVTDTSVALSWLPPTAGPLPVLGYWGTYDDVGSGANTFLFGDLLLAETVTGLEPGTVYTFQVWAQNADGEGPKATVVQTTTGVQSRAAQEATLLLTTQAGTLIVGVATKTVQVGALTLTALPGVTALTAAPQAVVGQVGALTFTALVGTKTVGAVTVTRQLALLALSGVQGSLTGGPATKTAQVAVLALTGVPGVRVTLVGRLAQLATLLLTAVPGATSVGGFIKQGQIGLLTWEAMPGRLGIPFALSAHSDGTGLKDQRVEIRVNNCDGQWGLFVRGPAVLNPAVEWPGYYVANTLDGVSWYRAGIRVETVTMPAFTTAGGTIELECIDDLCTLRVHGMAVSTHDFSANPITGDDDHQGFASYGGSGFVITDAEGGGILVAQEPEVDDEEREPLFPTSPPEQRRPLSSPSSSVRRPL
jgi:hypothetical protein